MCVVWCCGHVAIDTCFIPPALTHYPLQLNSHHIDIHNWSVSHMAHPVRVQAVAATGVAENKLGGYVEGGED